MKKITLSFCLVLLSSVFLTLNAQVLNQNANWPNPNWILTGTYSAATGALEADPTVDANFAFDDDDAGAGSDDSIAAESPEIDLTAAFNAGETHLIVDLDYVYRKFSVEEFLRIQYFDGETLTWVNWEVDSMPGNDTVLTNDFCLGAPIAYTSAVLDIAGFTLLQQSNFRYRFLYDDDPDGPAYEYGFCLNSPTISSVAPPNCTMPEATAVLIENCANGTFTVDVDVTSLGDATSLTISNDAGVTSTSVGAIGVFSAGPFPNYTAVNLTLEHDQDSVCNLSLGSFIDACPVANDECANAIDLDPFANADGSCTVTYFGSNIGATNSAGEVAPSATCVDGDATPADVWFTLTVPASGQFDFDFITNPGFSTIVELYTGTCGSLVALEPVVCGNGASRTFTDLTPSETVYLRVWDYGSDDEGDLEICINYLNCAPATVAYNVVEDCANSGGFNIVVDVTDLGTSTSIDINDDQGSATQSTGVTGMFTFGPYVNATDVVISITDNDDANCSQVSPTLTQVACPVANDECANAIDLDPFANADGSCTVTYLGSNIGATNSASEVAPSGTCSDGDAAPADVWFTLTVPASGEFNFDFITNPGFSTLVELYTGTCGSLTALDPVLCNNGASRTFTGLTPSETVYLRVWDYGSDDEGALEVCVNYLNCTPATVAYSVVEDCSNSGGFNIVVDVTDLGTSTSIDINDDQGSATQSTGVTGMFTFGPYVNATDVVISITDNDDANCSQVSPTLTQEACPPVNDDCSGAISLTPGNTFEANPMDGSVVGATVGAETNGCGLNGPGVWYSVVVPADGNITIETGPDTATGNVLFDSVIEAYSGACGALTSIECDDDDAATNNFSILDLSGLTPGETIYIRVWEYNGDESEPFAISAYNSTLSTTDFESQNTLTYFPNPVKNTLTLRALQNIKIVTVLNVLGQEVLKTNPNALENDLDMSSLTPGSYFVKVTINNLTETIRIIKQ